MTTRDCYTTRGRPDAAVGLNEALAEGLKNLPTQQDDPQRARAACNGASRPVTHKTMLLMLKPELLDRLGENEYRFCFDPHCRIVYFSEEMGQCFTTNDLRVRVGLKERDGEIPLCYCFGFDEARAREEIKETGRSTITLRILAFIQQGMCACPARNPSGACCLREVDEAIKRLMAETTVAEQAG